MNMTHRVSPVPSLSNVSALFYGYCNNHLLFVCPQSVLPVFFCPYASRMLVIHLTLTCMSIAGETIC